MATATAKSCVVAGCTSSEPQAANPNPDRLKPTSNRRFMKGTSFEIDGPAACVQCTRESACQICNLHRINNRCHHLYTEVRVELSNVVWRMAPISNGANIMASKAAFVVAALLLPALSAKVHADFLIYKIGTKGQKQQGRQSGSQDRR